MAKLGEGYCYAFFPESGDTDETYLPAARGQGRRSGSQELFNSGTQNHEYLNQSLSRDRVGYADGLLGGSRVEDGDISHNTTLSPCGSYHHIDLDIDQLYRRGSAFRPPSSTSGSVRGDSNFHSLPRSYKFRSRFDPGKGGFAEQSFGSGSGGMGGAGDRDGSGHTQDAQWEWYKNNVLKTPPKRQEENQVNFSAMDSDGFQPAKPPRSASYLTSQWQSPDFNEIRSETARKQTTPARTRSSAYKYHPRDSSEVDHRQHSGRHKDTRAKYDQQYPSLLQDRYLQSWPNQDQIKISRQLDVPTPSSLSSHPFFVPEDQPVSPPPVIRMEATPQHGSHQRDGDEKGARAKSKARGDKRPIQTVREEPDMPDNEVLETRLKKKQYPLNGVRLRMSISAGDLIGKTHDELVLLLIQLRRNQSALEKARDFYREVLGKRRPAEREYRRQRHDSVGRLDRSVEEEHQSFVDTRSHLEEIEKKLEVYRPLINLVDNMVTMGSLYGGDNLMLATQYRKHLLRPDQYQPPRKMLEFSRKHQEEQVVANIEADVRKLTAAEVDLEEKIDRLNQLERLLQEQSFKVSSFREDKELLEKALLGIIRQQKECRDSPHELRRLIQQQASVEKELSRVTQDLAEASKALEETTVENNKIEHEVALLRTKVHGDLKRSKSAPSLATDNANAKVKMERELARVQNMLQGLSQQGEKLSNAMSTIRRSSSGTQLAAAFDDAEKARKAGTYMQTDIDSGEQVDLAQQIPMQSPTSPDGVGISDGRPVISHQRQESTHGGSGLSDADSSREWDIGEADDNTKRFYGLLPREKPERQTVRDVKRQSEQRRERKRDEEGQEVALKVSSTDSDTSTFIHTRYPSYASSQSSGLDLSARDPSAPLYENLPRSGSMPALNNDSSTGARRSSLSLMAPKPFTPYQDKTAKPFKSELALNSSQPAGAPGFDEQTGRSFPPAKPYASELTLNSSGNYSQPGTRFPGVQHEPIAAGQVGLVTARPLRIGPPTDVSGYQPSYSRTAQPFSRDATGYSQSSPHLNAYEPTPIAPPSFDYHSQPSPGRDIQSGLYDVKKSPKGRYMTVSSSQPTRLEPDTFKSPTLRSSAGDLISNARVDDVPDVVKSSLTNVDKIDQIDVDTIDRECLFLPEKVVIPERYDAEADAEHLTEAQRLERQEKAERIKRLLTNQSVLSMSQPDVNHVPPSQLHSQVLREKQERAQLLTLGQELARQVTQQSKKAAAERRKTWSGGQFADIKKQYEAELAANPDRFASGSRTMRQANVVL
ncbi:hypothetical protein BaRGS_00032776 [Batillaria attramentaria]|uniref:Pleckstrin homology domain-containing protein n=1 Tax=Batillaria attramentaria TaxID=370345 RepID=A0ABD0JLV1_9CAEN